MDMMLTGNCAVQTMDSTDFQQYSPLSVQTFNSTDHC
uniref:Uncharacterized protein n=1 Tax=Anguilla anguilla TaxID=7936 RepID=A0A0E9WKD6_ANGAN